MMREMLRAKIHRPAVTETNVNYEGSLTLDPEMMREAGMLPFERVDIYNCGNGARFSTYLIEGRPGAREVCVNGAAAHLAQPGDRIIIASYAAMAEDEIATHRPTIVLVDASNTIRSIHHDVASATEFQTS